MPTGAAIIDLSSSERISPRSIQFYNTAMEDILASLDSLNNFMIEPIAFGSTDIIRMFN